MQIMMTSLNSGLVLDFISHLHTSVVPAVVVLCITSGGQPLIDGMTKHEPQHSYNHNSSSGAANLKRMWVWMLLPDTPPFSTCINDKHQLDKKHYRSLLPSPYIVSLRTMQFCKVLMVNSDQDHQVLCLILCFSPCSRCRCPLYWPHSPSSC